MGGSTVQYSTNLGAEIHDYFLISSNVGVIQIDVQDACILHTYMNSFLYIDIFIFHCISL